MIQEISKLEERLNQAILNSDVQTLDQLMHDDLVFVNHLGMKLSKMEDLAPHIHGDLKITRLELSAQHIHSFGKDTFIVVVSKQIEGNYLEKSFEGKFRFMRIWKLSDKQWKVIAVSSSTMME